MDKTLRVGGFTPFTAIDFPGALSAVVFCQGCPWRCRYCHNGGLLPAQADTQYEWQQLLQHLQTRRGLLDAVVFSGGEPTAQGALEDAVQDVKAMGFKVGLHTAGMYPRRLARLLPHLDWVGLDIKALPENYDAITRVPGSGTAPWQSAALLTEAGIPLQVRLTRHPQLTSDGELAAIHERLAALGITGLIVQKCNTDNALDPELQQ
ncbi:anaerobic ribonucleoside-triphosphate reductase activating protein [Microbulbifer sp. YPW1]|uniref:anaerobic ribonucleoside-triphosphate reductase activating protein n=1 Tax=Microbulbifer sp. YPW1 TaxID=2745199 RepID=UPI0015978FFF|nr:anaerobic ribonucleoside-triphosphate reductase activating protein [Microbulbifer sp. YPW1]QKX15897.1 anaerobic ribonucleoside-triphosphate reductase activating protein [Microbulbifer sp. YPW1]